MLPLLSPEPARPVEELFREFFGRDAGTIARAPGRVNLIGEHTDYHGGLCLPIAIPSATWVALAPRQDDVLVLRSTHVPDPWTGRVGSPGDGWAAYVTSALAAVGHRTGVDLLIDSTVPVGAGLSSSAALICAVATAVSSAPPDELVAPCIAAEVDGVGAPTGGLDQTTCLLAREGHALLLDFGVGSRSHVPWRPEEAGLELLVVDTRTRHSHAAGGYRDRREESERAMSADPAGLDEVGVRRRRHVESENDRVRQVVSALARNDWAEVGRAFTASHESLRDDYEVSCDELDLAVGTALAAGALGARMTGGGFGGCAIVLAPRSLRGVLLEDLEDAFRIHRFATPAACVASASGPALRTRAPAGP